MIFHFMFIKSRQVGVQTANLADVLAHFLIIE